MSLNLANVPVKSRFVTARVVSCGISLTTGATSGNNVRQHIAGRDPRLPEGCNVPSRAKPYEPGSLGSGAVGEPAVSKQTRHVSLRTQSGGTGQRSGRTAREGMAPS